MSAKSAIKKLHTITKGKETQKSEHRQKHEEEAELLRKKETKEEL